MRIKSILLNLPEVMGPTEKRLPFNAKLKWTGIILLLFFILGLVPLFGLGANSLAQFQFLSLILGAEFGSIISLGIGPIVTASILLQLLNGSGIVKFDLNTPDGKKLFQGVQKGLAFAFVVFEAGIYVFAGGLAPAAGYSPFTLIFQLTLGGIMIIFMDEVVSKWGFGQGVSLFIAAGVSKEIMVRLLSPLSSSGNLAFTSGEAPIGALLSIFYFLAAGDLREVTSSLAAIFATVFVFVIAVYTQAMKVEVPLSFGRIRGHGIRWPLAFIYTSNIPVILTAALLANFQLWARLLENRGIPILGAFGPGGTGVSGLALWLSSPNIIGNLVRGIVAPIDFARAGTYALFLMGGSVLFSIFWVKTAGMDARSQAKKMMDYGLQIPGFRRDERVLESLLNRYIPALTVMGAIAVGFLAASADVSGALTSGTGLLLTVMIIYRLYEEIAQQHALDMNPLLKKFMEK
ncbi:preprotein translocase subunit SecY [Candidatus Woesearchaeota archaeon]|nr:preprotein translocase subunit SecY [Candidatus Woesearchaeota archaeon]